MPYMHSRPFSALGLASDHGHRIIVMGVSGAGKTTVGQALADKLQILFRDADDLHPLANVDKMRAGHPLTDEDRWEWLELVANSLRRDTPVIIACSALRKVYRDHIRAGAGGPVTFVHLVGHPDVIASRLAGRLHNYMPNHLLESQLQTLEPPTMLEALIVPIDVPVSAQVAMICQTILAH